MPAELVRLGSGAGFTLGTRPLPLAADIVEGVAPEGLDIAAIVDELIATGLLDAALRGFVQVRMNDWIVPREKWPRVRPKAASRLFISVLPKGGGGGGSNVGRIVLTLAIVALAAYAGPQIAGALLASTASAGAVAAVGAAISASIVVAGNLLVNALIPIKQPDQQARKARYSLSGASNQPRPNEPVPMIFGRRRTFPPRCANPYTVMVGQDVYLRCMMQPSASWVNRDEVKIGETSVDAYEGVTINWHTRPDDATTPLWFDRVVAEDIVSVPVKQSSGWVTRAAPIAATKLSIDVGFPAGLYEIKKSSGQPSIPRAVQFEVRYGPAGGDPDAASNAPIGSGGTVTYTMAVAESWRATLEWEVAAGEYDVHLRRVTADVAESNTSISDVLSWVCIRSFGAGAPIADPENTPWVEIEVKASDQLNGVLDTFNFVASSLVKEATVDGPGATWLASRNPADLFLAASLPPFSDLDLDEDERDLEAIAEWRDLCEAQGWHCDLGEDQEQSIGELLVRIATCGMARPTMGSKGLSVVVDWEKPAPLQMFTARNVSKFRGSIIFPAEVHGLRLRFQNAAKGYDDDTVVVYAPGFDADTATAYESIEVRDKADSDEVEALGLRIIAQRILRPETFVFEQDVEYVAVRDGDRAQLAHPVALIGQVSGRIVDLVTRAGGTQHGVVLDELVVMEAGKTYALAWRSTLGGYLSTSTLAIEIGESDTLWFVSTPSTLPEEGDLVTVGEQSIETVDVIVNRITPKPGLKAEIECVPYAPELQSLDVGDVVVYRSGAARPPALPGAATARRDLRSAEKMLTAINARVAEASGWAGAAVADGIITVSEKRDLVPRLVALLGAVAILGTIGDPTPQRTSYVAAVSALSALLAALDTPTDWDDMTGDTVVVNPTAFWQAVRDVEQTERALRSVLTSAALSPVPQSRLAPLLAQRIEAIDTSVIEGFVKTNRARVIATTNLAQTRSELGARVGEAVAMIVSESTARVDGDGALSRRIDILTADAGSFSALVAAEVTARADADGALATTITTVAASTLASANSTAATALSSAITTEQTARSNGDSTNATAITNVTSRLDSISGSGVSVETKISTSASAITGLQGQYAVRIDVNGAVAGFGLASGGGSTSEFTIRADHFFFTDTSGSPVSPFYISGGVVYASNLVVGTANIVSLSVGTLQLAGSAVNPDKMAPGATGKAAVAYDENGVGFNSTSSWTNIHSISLTPEEGYPVEGTFTTSCVASSDTKGLFQIVRDDGSVVFGGTNGFREHVDSNGTTITIPFVDVVDASRSTTWYLQGKKAAGSTTITCDNRYGRAEENPRATYQSFSITLDGGGGGVGPGGGGGGGGLIP